jgi:hypothetical protein
MSATCRRHVGNKAKCRLFSSQQANFCNMIFSVLAHICVGISRHLLTKDRQYLVERTTNSYVNGDLHNRSPQNKKPQKIIRHLHPLASRLHLLPRRRLTLHPLCLFVRPFVCSFGWLLHRLSAPCCRVLSRLVAAPRRSAIVSHRPSSSSSRCVIASSHLFSPRHCIVHPDATRHA